MPTGCYAHRPITLPSACFLGLRTPLRIRRGHDGLNLITPGIEPSRQILDPVLTCRGNIVLLAGIVP